MTDLDDRIQQIIRELSSDESPPPGTQERIRAAIERHERLRRRLLSAAAAIIGAAIGVVLGLLIWGWL